MEHQDRSCAALELFVLIAAGLGCELRLEQGAPPLEIGPERFGQLGRDVVEYLP